MRSLTKFILITMLVFKASVSHSQKLNTIFHLDSTKMKIFRANGEMFVKGSELKEIPTLLVGGRVGFMINRKFAFGAMAQGFFPKSTFNGSDLSGNLENNLQLNVAVAGVYVEPIIAMAKAVHISFPINFLLGDVEVNKNETDEKIEGSRLRCIEPSVNLEFNCTQYLIMSVNVGYRIAQINNLTNLDDRDMSGFFVGLVGKIGRF
jgi:hypothetical protein